MEQAKIIDILTELAAKNQIRIIYAVEAGSRAWKLESDDSDYDIRFIFVHNDPKKYVSLKQIKETIDGFSEDRLYDWQGWELTKALKLLHQMNPSIVEWIYSPIVYMKDESIPFLDSAKRLLNEQNRISPLLYHYRSMAKSNYKTHIENRERVNLKKYLYVIRPAGMVEWLLKCKDSKRENLIEIDFNIVLESLKEHLTKECHDNICQIIETKKKVKESNEEQRIKCIDEWIDRILNKTQDEIRLVELAQPGEKQSLDDYDSLLHSILKITF
jgi:predicted nucleotidyltransferase